MNNEKMDLTELKIDEVPTEIKKAMESITTSLSLPNIKYFDTNTGAITAIYPSAALTKSDIHVLNCCSSFIGICSGDFAIELIFGK